MREPTGTERRVCDLLAQRQSLGLNKYGTTVAENPLTLRQWLVHQQEELADALVYCTRAIEELDAKGVQIADPLVAKNGHDFIKGLQTLLGKIESGQLVLRDGRSEYSLGDPTRVWADGRVAYSRVINVRLEVGGTP